RLRISGHATGAVRHLVATGKATMDIKTVQAQTESGPHHCRTAQFARPSLRSGRSHTLSGWAPDARRVAAVRSAYWTVRSLYGRNLRRIRGLLAGRPVGRLC